MTVSPIQDAVPRIFNHIRDRFPFNPLGSVVFFFPYDKNSGLMSDRYASQYQHMLRIQYEKEKAKDWNKAQEVH